MNEFQLWKKFESKVSPTSYLEKNLDRLEPIIPHSILDKLWQTLCYDRSIIQYGFPGSGSTFVWQILNYLFKDVKKTHNCPKYHKNRKVVATVRDFRDILCTYFKRYNLPVTKDSILSLVNQQGAESFHQLYKVSEEWKESENILWLKYEDCYGNYGYLLNKIEDFFDFELTDEQKKYISNEYSITANKKRAEEASSLCTTEGAKGWLDNEWIPYVKNGINGSHITDNGRVGKWKSIIPEDLHDFVNELLKDALEKYGYINN